MRTDYNKKKKIKKMRSETETARSFPLWYTFVNERIYRDDRNVRSNALYRLHNSTTFVILHIFSVSLSLSLSYIHNIQYSNR